jgi:hypothetical protein
MGLTLDRVQWLAFVPTALNFLVLLSEMDVWPYLSCGFPPLWSRLETGSVLVGFVVDKATLGQVFSEYFGFPC